MRSRQVGGAALIVVGLLPIGWAVRHRHEPLVGARPKTVEPVYYGESRPLIAFTMGLGAVWCGWLLLTTPEKRKPG
jgi:hypothetical protein